MQQEHDADKPENWQKETKAILDESLDKLDPEIAARLIAARQRALRGTVAGNRRPALWVGAAAASVLAVTILWQLPAGQKPTQDAELVQILDDMELLENMDMLHALEALADEV